MLNQSKKYQSILREVNEYEKSKELRVQENQKRLAELGVKNIVKSMTSLAQSQIMKKKKVKQNVHAGDVDYIPEMGDDEQAARNVVLKKQQPPKFISPMSTNRVVNLTKLRRVLASNVSQKVPSTSIRTKMNTNEIVGGNKGGAKRRLVLVDEEDDNEDHIFQGGHRVDTEVDDIDQDHEYEDMDDMIHTNNQYDPQMEVHANVQEQLQGPYKEKTTSAPKKVRGYTQKTEI